MNPTLDKTLSCLIYGSLMILALGLVTSTSLLALSHILILIPMLYFLPKADYKSFPKSAWALLAMAIVIILSIVLNQDIAVKGYKPVSKTKYFITGFTSVAPLYWYFKNHMTEKKITWLLYAFCIATTVATISGLIAQATGMNPITMRAPEIARNSGLFGMVMNYAHNLSYFLVIILGLIIYRDEVKKYINIKFLIGVFVINLIGFYFSYTRGAWLGFTLGAPFFFLKNNKKNFLILGSVLIFIGMLSYFVAGKSMNRSDNDETRIIQWKAATYAFIERPILGYGYLNFENKVIDIKKRYNLGNLNFASHAHNNFFEMLGATGALGFISFILWLGFWFKESFNRNDIRARIALPLIVVFIVGGLTQSTISLGINLFFIMACYSVTAAMLKREGKV